VQGPVPEERTLEDLIGAAFARPEAPLDEARQFVRLAAAGLAALHRSGVGPGEIVTWREQYDELGEMLDRIRRVVPDAGLDEAIRPLIDFDAYCQAEPAMDVGEFVAALPDLATKAGAHLDRADALAEEFLAAYERLAPLSRERVALWRDLHFTVEALRTWTKPKSTGGAGDLAILEHYARSAPP
jgi:hypothetical protein